MFKVIINGIENETVYIKVCGRVVPLLIMRPAGKTEENEIAEQTGADAEQAGADAEQAGADAEQTGADAEQARADAEQARADAEQARTDAERGGTDTEQSDTEQSPTSNEYAAERFDEYASESNISPNKASNVSKGATGVLWIHGGGYATGMKELAYMGRAQDLVRRHGAIVISPGYHLSALHPYPTGLKECYAALLYMKKHAAELGINSSQLMVGGESAGGGLAAAICMMARDRGDVNIAFQMPLYPMIDNFDTDSSRDNHNKVWNTKRNHMAWRMYLRSDYKKEVYPYAAPARQTDYRNLPPAYTFVCTDEPFYCETLTFIKNLQEASVEAKVDVYEGMYHAFDMMNRKHPTSCEAIKKFNEYFEYAQKRYFRENQ